MFVLKLSGIQNRLYIITLLKHYNFYDALVNFCIIDDTPACPLV